MTTEQRLGWGTFVGVIIAVMVTFGTIVSGADPEDRQIFVVVHPTLLTNPGGGCRVTTVPQHLTVWNIDDVSWSLLNLCNTDDDLYIEAFKDDKGNAADPMTFENSKKKKQKGKAKDTSVKGYFKYTVRVGGTACGQAGALCEDPEIDFKKH